MASTEAERASTEVTASTGAEATPETTDDDVHEREQEQPQGSTSSCQIVPFKRRGPFIRRKTAARRRHDETPINVYFPIVEWSYLSMEKIFVLKFCDGNIISDRRMHDSNNNNRGMRWHPKAKTTREHHPPLGLLSQHGKGLSNYVE
ncbi:hypothetical protein E3N88_43283 [Mikania micrantha]|uniref:Uncharacterized protein n=1 Tax=Mikania micrantha TaxID=192012 RepID=A0A5N6LFD1_9ASTR|nr:hypothetical protein E3N88_43283 [Mikania micrantha]